MRGATWAATVAGSAVGALAAVLAVAAFGGAAPACASVPGPASGTATHYRANGGNCTYPVLPADRLVAALGPAEYGEAEACGTSYDLRGPNGKVRVRIVDKCVKCRPGEFDLSEEAFARLAPLKTGKIKITYERVVDPPVAPLAVRVRGGSNPYWLSLLVMNHGNAVAHVRARSKTHGWATLKRTGYNAWQAARGLGEGPFTVEITDDRDHRATVTGIRLVIDLVQPTTTRLYPARPPVSRTPSPAVTAAVPACAASSGR